MNLPFSRNGAANHSPTGGLIAAAGGGVRVAPVTPTARTGLKKPPAPSAE